MCPRCWREAALARADVAWALWRKSQTNRWRYVLSLKDAAPLFPAKDALQALRWVLQRFGPRDAAQYGPRLPMLRSCCFPMLVKAPWSALCDCV